MAQVVKVEQFDSTRKDLRQTSGRVGMAVVYDDGVTVRIHTRASKKSAVYAANIYREHKYDIWGCGIDEIGRS